MGNRFRNVRIPFRLTEEEVLVLKKKMEVAGVENRNAFIRKMIFDGYVINMDLSVVKALNFQLSKIGTNVNQIAHIANLTSDVPVHVLDDLKGMLQEIYNLKSTLLESLEIKN